MTTRVLHGRTVPRDDYNEWTFDVEIPKAETVVETKSCHSRKSLFVCGHQFAHHQEQLAQEGGIFFNKLVYALWTYVPGNRKDNPGRRSRLRKCKDRISRWNILSQCTKACVLLDASVLERETPRSSDGFFPGWKGGSGFALRYGSFPYLYEKHRQKLRLSMITNTVSVNMRIGLFVHEMKFPLITILRADTREQLSCSVKQITDPSTIIRRRMIFAESDIVKAA